MKREVVAGGDAIGLLDPEIQAAGRHLGFVARLTHQLDQHGQTVAVELGLLTRERGVAHGIHGGQLSRPSRDEAQELVPVHHVVDDLGVPR